MPIVALKNVFEVHLDSLGFKKPEGNFTFSPRNTLKNTILTGNGLDVFVIDEKRFKINMQPQRYFEALSTDYFYSLQKVRRQRESIEALIGNDTPGAWILVSAYYQAFYAAIETSRLLGTYNSSFQDSDIAELNGLNQSTAKLTKSGTYKGEVQKTGAGDIEIIFAMFGSRPHMHTWENMKVLLNSQRFRTNIDNKNIVRVRRLEEIINKSKKQFPTPSELRNEWNYAISNAYDSSTDCKFKEMNSMLSGTDFSCVKSWADKKVSTIDDSSKFVSLSYVNNIFSNALEIICSRII